MDEFSSTWKCSLTPVFSRIPGKGDKIRSGYITPTFSGGPKWVEVLHNPLRSRGSPSKGDTNGLRRASGKMPRGAVLKGGP